MCRTLEVLFDIYVQGQGDNHLIEILLISYFLKLNLPFMQ